MPDDILPPAPGTTDPPPVPEPRGAGRLRCGFCDAALTPGGEVLKLSERAKALRDFEDDLADAKADLSAANVTIDTLTSKVAELEREVSRLKADAEKKKKSFFS